MNKKTKRQIQFYTSFHNGQKAVYSTPSVPIRCLVPQPASCAHSCTTVFRSAWGNAYNCSNSPASGGFLNAALYKSVKLYAHSSFIELV